MFIFRKFSPIIQFCMTCVIILFLISLVMIFNYKVDYMGWNESGLVNNTNSRKYNAVIAKTMDYDAVIMGSSLSENFKCSEFDTIFHTHSLKLTMFSAHISDLLFTLRYANQFKKIKMIMFDLNYSMFLRDSPLVTFPFDMYKTGRFSLKELVQVATFYQSLNKLFNETLYISRDDLYSWGKYLPVGKKVLAKHLLTLPVTQNKCVILPINQKTLDFASNNIRNHLIPLLKENQDKSIILFFPPYYALAYEDVNPDGIVELKKMISNSVLNFENVRLYDFQVKRDVIEKSDHYKDKLHYGPKISSLIIHEFLNDTYRITKSNLDSNLKEFHDYIEQLDSSIFYDELKMVDISLQ